MSSSPLSVDAKLNCKRLRRVRLPLSVTDAKVAWKSNVCHGKTKSKQAFKERTRRRQEKLEHEANVRLSDEDASLADDEWEWEWVNEEIRLQKSLLSRLFTHMKSYLTWRW